ncbi:hypothetical protein TNCV_2268621 [Trichonephila clavipes]|nr:hypothetical protein TNCV_2268621 [Trichonephila clavipes]
MPPHIQTGFVCILEPLDKLAIIADKVSDVVGASSTICAVPQLFPSTIPVIFSCSAQPTMDSSRQADPRAVSTNISRGSKQALADAALLAHPSPSAPLALHVDASDYAIGRCTSPSCGL